MLDFLSSIFGSKPEIADYTPVDLSDEQLKALQGDIAAWPKIQQLGSLYQQYMLDAYETAIPGFKDILKMGGQTTQQMLGTASEELAGKIPEDVAGQVQRTSAFQNLLSGGGGGMASANTARNYGLTSLNLIQQGAQLAGQAGNAAQRWASLSGAQLPEGMLVTPQQQAQLDMQQNLIKRNIQQQKYNVAAAPDPVAKGLSDLVANLTAAYLGGMGGGKMGGGGGGGAPSAMTASQYGVGDVSSSYGYGAAPTSGYSKDTAAPMDLGGYYGGYGGVSPGSDGNPAYYGIQSNPFNSTGTSGVNIWDQYAYNSNFSG